MSDQNGSAKKSFQSNALIELFLIVALALTMLSTDIATIGQDLAVTSVSVGLMVLLTCWTLTTAFDGLTLMASRQRRAP